MADSITMAILNNEVSLDIPCWNCHGEEKKTAKNEDYPWEDGVCSICKGKGYELTNAGEAIIALIHRHSG